MTAQAGVISSDREQEPGGPSAWLRSIRKVEDDSQSRTEKTYEERAGVHFERLLALLSEHSTRELRGAAGGAWQTNFEAFVEKKLKKTFPNPDFDAAKLIKGVFAEQFQSKNEKDLEDLKKRSDNPVTVAVVSLLSKDGYEGDLSDEQEQVKQAVELVLIDTLMAFLKEEIGEEKGSEKKSKKKGEIVDESTVLATIKTACSDTVKMWLVLANLESNDLLSAPQTKDSRFSKPQFPLRYDGIVFGNDHGLKGGIVDQLLAASKPANDSEKVLNALLDQWRDAIASGDRLTWLGVAQEHKIMTPAVTALLLAMLYFFGSSGNPFGIAEGSTGENNETTAPLIAHVVAIGANNAQLPGSVTEIGANREAATAAQTYVVQPGESLFGIAPRLGVDPYELARLNNISIEYRADGEFALIHPGDVLLVPGAELLQQAVGIATEPVPTDVAAVHVEAMVWKEAGTEYHPILTKISDEIVAVSLECGLDPDLVATALHFAPQVLIEINESSDLTKRYDILNLKKILERECAILAPLAKSSNDYAAVATMYLEKKGVINYAQMTDTYPMIVSYRKKWGNNYSSLVEKAFDEKKPAWETWKAEELIKTNSAPKTDLLKMGLVETQTEAGKNQELDTTRPEETGVSPWWLAVCAAPALIGALSASGYVGYRVHKGLPIFPVPKSQPSHF